LDWSLSGEGKGGKAIKKNSNVVKERQASRKKKIVEGKAAAGRKKSLLPQMIQTGRESLGHRPTRERRHHKPKNDLVGARQSINSLKTKLIRKTNAEEEGKVNEGSILLGRRGSKRGFLGVVSAEKRRKTGIAGGYSKSKGGSELAGGGDDVPLSKGWRGSLTGRRPI